MNPPLTMMDLEGSVATIQEHPLISQPITVVAPPPVANLSHAKMVEDKKYNIISDAWQAINNRKVVLAMGETSSVVFNIDRNI